MQVEWFLINRSTVHCHTDQRHHRSCSTDGWSAPQQSAHCQMTRLQRNSICKQTSEESCTANAQAHWIYFTLIMICKVENVYFPGNIMFFISLLAEIIPVYVRFRSLPQVHPKAEFWLVNFVRNGQSQLSLHKANLEIMGWRVTAILNTTPAQWMRKK